MKKKARRPKANTPPSPPAAAPDPRWTTEASIELEDLANVVWMIHCGVDINNDTDALGSALLQVQRELRRLSNRVAEELRAACETRETRKKAVA
jgi:hypothetical protein